MRKKTARDLKKKKKKKKKKNMKPERRLSYTHTVP